MKNRPQLQSGPFGELISSYSYRRASAGEFDIALQLQSGPLQEKQNAILFASMVLHWNIKLQTDISGPGGY